MRLLVAPVLAGLIFAVTPGFAQEDQGPAPGRVHASTYFQVKLDQPLNVRPLDNSAANLRIKTGFADALSKRGVRLTEQRASLALNFETEVESLNGSIDGPSLGQVRADQDDKRVRLNFWSSSQDSVLTGRHTGGSSGTVRFILRVTLDDQASGQRLWASEATYTGAAADETSTFIGMASVVAENLGQSLRPKAFRLD